MSSSASEHSQTTAEAIVLLGAGEPDARQIVAPEQAADGVDESENGRRAGVGKIGHPCRGRGPSAVLTGVRR